jgi:ferric-dicitrate binding protein FerR (iron transport regulator)
MMRMLGLRAALPFMAGMAAGLRTATGEQKTIDLADGSRVVLNTASAWDIVFNAEERRLKLHAGEIQAGSRCSGCRRNSSQVCEDHGASRRGAN